MAMIVIEIDTENKEKSSVKIDGKALKNVTAVSVFGMDDPKYMSVDIDIFEKGGEEKGAIRKLTRLMASDKTEGKLVEDTNVDTKELAELLLKREIS